MEFDQVSRQYENDTAVQGYDSTDAQVMKALYRNVVSPEAHFAALRHGQTQAQIWMNHFAQNPEVLFNGVSEPSQVTFLSMQEVGKIVRNESARIMPNGVQIGFTDNTALLTQYFQVPLSHTLLNYSFTSFCRPPYDQNQVAEPLAMNISTTSPGNEFPDTSYWMLFAREHIDLKYSLGDKLAYFCPDYGIKAQGSRIVFNYRQVKPERFSSLILRTWYSYYAQENSIFGNNGNFYRLWTCNPQSNVVVKADREFQIGPVTLGYGFHE